MSEIRPNICRLCTAFCPVLVEVESGRAVKVTGDPSNDVYQGYTCPKGRALAELHNSPTRLLRSLKRDSDGVHRPIDVERAMDEIAEKVSAIVERHGPRSVALYIGTGSLPYPATMPAARSWLRSIGSPMFFTPGAIDQPGKSTAMALHGGWEAGEQSFYGADTYLLVGMNPVISKCHGILGQNPGGKLKEAVDNGLQLIVIDPRYTETARRAAVHLQLRPGEDPTLMAGLVRLVIEEKLYDAEFVANNAEGLEQLAGAVRGFTPDYVSERTGVPAKDIIKAARIFAGAGRGCAIAGTGPSFSTRGDITEYLCLCLNTLCGRWVRAGEKVPRPNVMLPAHTARAQPIPPFPPSGFGQKMRVRGLTASAAGLPTAALTDEMLLEGEGQIKAFINVAGNPMMAFPDQKKTRAALEKLELHVTIDTEMSATAQHADYVIAPLQSFETPGMSHAVEGLKYYGFGLGLPVPWAQYAPRTTEPPEGSELIEEWQFFQGLAKRMGSELKLMTAFRAGSYIESEPVFFTLDNDNPPSTEEIIEQMTATSRVPLEEIKRFPNGHLFDDIDERAAPREPGNEARLRIGAEYIIEQLEKVRGEDYRSLRRDGEFPYLLVSRRINNILNSIGRSVDKLTKGQTYNPVCIHPDDLAALGFESGENVWVRSPNGAIPAVLEADETLRRGVVSMAQNFGGQPDEDHRFRELGSNTNRLIAADDDYDPITGIPRMGAIPVAIAQMKRETRESLHEGSTFV